MQRTIRLTVLSHHEAKSTRTIVTQFVADWRLVRGQLEYINCCWYLNLEPELLPAWSFVTDGQFL